MTKPNETKSSLFAGGQLLPETSPEEYQKAAREDLDVTFDDARIADMRTQAVARAEAGLADWERRVPRIADRSGWWRVTFAGLEAPFTVGAAESRKTIIATARMVWEGTHKMKPREGEELDIQPLDGRAPHLSAGYGTMTLTAKHSAPSPKYHHNWQDGALTGEQMRVPTSPELHHLAEANGSVFVPGRRPCRVMEVNHARGLHGMARLAFGDGRGTDWVPLIDLRVPEVQPEVDANPQHFHRDTCVGCREERMCRALPIGALCGDCERRIGSSTSWNDTVRERMAKHEAAGVVGRVSLDADASPKVPGFYRDLDVSTSGPITFPVVGVQPVALRPSDDDPRDRAELLEELLAARLGSGNPSAPFDLATLRVPTSETDGTVVLIAEDGRLVITDDVGNNVGVAQLPPTSARLLARMLMQSADAEEAKGASPQAYEPDSEDGA